MIIQNAKLICPDLVNIWTVFEFSPDSRFVYTIFGKDKIPIIEVYDSKFNNSVELKADLSITELAKQVNGFHFVEAYFLTVFVDINRLLVVFDHRFFQQRNAVLIVLVELDLQRGCYRLLEKLVYTDYTFPTLVRDGDQIGMVNVRADYYAPNDKKLGYTPIQIENDKMKVRKRVEFNYNLNIIKPCDPHLFDNKLWYYRDESSTAEQTGKFLERQICYFDLKEECPREIKFVTISSINIRHHQWVGGHFLCGKNRFELACINLTTGNWTHFESSIPIDSYYTNQAIWLRIYRLPSIFSNSSFVAFSDRKLNLNAINLERKELHKIPLKEPFKLMDLAWNCALNANLLSQEPILQCRSLGCSKLF